MSDTAIGLELADRLDAVGVDMIRYGEWHRKLCRDGANKIRHQDKRIAELEELLRVALMALKVNGDVVRATTIGKLTKALEEMNK